MQIPLIRWLLAVAFVGSLTTVHAQNQGVSGTLEIWGTAVQLETLQAADEAFRAEYPEIELEYVPRDTADTYQQIQLSVASGSGTPDITAFEDSRLKQFASLGVLFDLTDRVQPYLEQMNDFKWDRVSWDGRTYAMPWDSGPVAVFYRRDVFERAGVDPSSIQTWDDYLQAAETIKEKTGVAMWQESKANNDARLLEMLLWQQGLGYVDADGNVVLDEDPRVLETLEYIGQFWDDGLAVGDAQAWTEGWYQNFADGKVASHVIAVWMGAFLKGFIAPESEGEWGVFALPRWDDETPQASNDGGSSLAIFEASDNKEAAWAYTEFHLGRPESQLAMYEASDIFPSLETTYDAPYFSEPDPYFGGQEVREFFTEVVTKIPDAHIYTEDYAEMNALLQAEIQAYALGRQSAEQALANAAREIRSRTGRQ